MALTIPAELQALVQDFDLATSIKKNDYINVVVKDLKFEELQQPSCIVGTIDAPDRKHSNMFSGGDGSYPSRTLTHRKVYIHAQPDELTKLHRSQRVYMHATEVVRIEPFAVHLQVRCNTMIIAMNEDFRKAARPHLWVIEQYCGGFGGWQHALRWLHSYDHWATRTLAIDHAIECVIQFGLTHKFQIIGNPTGAPPDFLHKYPYDTVICSAIHSKEWQHMICNLQPYLWCISAPCVSWSGSGSGQGFFAPEGRCIGHSLGQIRTHRPRAVVFEMVSNFTSHDHFEIFSSTCGLGWLLHCFCQQLRAFSCSTMQKKSVVGSFDTPRKCTSKASPTRLAFGENLSSHV